MDKAAKPIKKEIPEHILKKYAKKPIKKFRGLVLTSLNKLYWPEENYTKGSLIAYYNEIGKYILPYLKNRPIILHRFPNGITGQDFYQKNINFSLPMGIETTAVRHEGRTDQYFLINNKRSLLYAANLGSIDLHPLIGKIKSLAFPSYCVIDLDPHDVSFNKVIEAALVVHDLLSHAKIDHYCKTSGGNGLHILIPLNAKYTFDQSRQLAEKICQLVHEQLPHTTSLERVPEKRPQQVYLDFMQNRFGQAIVAPYSVRPRSKALISTPLLWDEVNEDLSVANYTMQTVPERLKQMGDIFKPVLGKGIHLRVALSNLKK